MNITFEKWHGAGNDFVMIANWGREIVLHAGQIQHLCDRHFGIGADAVILVESSDVADLKMNYFNNDGTPAETCGNGLRCTVAFAIEHGLLPNQKNCSSELELAAAQLKIENSGGAVEPLTITSRDPWQVKVNMGTPTTSGVADFPDDFLQKEVDLGELGVVQVSCISMGNPHGVVFVEDVENYDLESLGKALQSHEMFPNSVNVEIVEISSSTSAKQRTYERGVGETLACGSGACAVTVAGTLAGHFPENANVDLSLRGGNLEMHWDQSIDKVWKTGPAEKAFGGEVII